MDKITWIVKGTISSSNVTLSHKTQKQIGFFLKNPSQSDIAFPLPFVQLKQLKTMSDKTPISSSRSIPI